MSDQPISIPISLYREVHSILSSARANVRTVVNTAMVTTYWQIGRLIVEEEQRGAERAGYGKQLLALLSQRLTEDFGKGFGVSNVNYFRQFYQAFPMCHSVSDECSTTSKSCQTEILHAVSGESPPR